jgi:hypothetical protein
MMDSRFLVLDSEIVLKRSIKKVNKVNAAKAVIAIAIISGVNISTIF